MAKKKTGQKKPEPKKEKLIPQAETMAMYRRLDDLECRVDWNSHWLEFVLISGCAFFVTLILFAPGPGGNHH